MNPFGSSYAKEFLLEELGEDMELLHQNVLQYLYDIYFHAIADEPSDEERADFHRIMHRDSELSDEEIDSILDDRYLDEEIGWQCWMAACLMDSLLCRTDYSEECGELAGQYRRIIGKMENEAARRKLLSRKPVFDLPKITDAAARSLDFVLGKAAECELAEKMRSEGRYGLFERCVTELRDRLAGA
ncbi:MAG: hypothetical protein IJ071_10915 [Ruminococcus sp.]|nr:hypothetical protein [Ruminococcus sp.]